MRIVLFVVLLLADLATAQAGEVGAYVAEEASPGQDTSTAGMRMDVPVASSLPSPHEGSGTAWQPASASGHEWMRMRGDWELMAHGVVFIDYNQQGGSRGEGKAESVNWGMLMEQHKLGRGTILFREMLSAESLTSPHPGFPELFQTGETYHGQPLVDHQHPHNVFAELAGLYTLPLTKPVSSETLRRSIGRTCAGTCDLYSSRFGGGAAHGSTRPSFAGLNAHQFRRGDHGVRDSPGEAGGLRVQWT